MLGDRHASYVGWVMAQLQRQGFLVRSDGANRLHVMPTVFPPGEPDSCFEVEVPPPPMEWNS